MAVWQTHLAPAVLRLLRVCRRPYVALVLAATLGVAWQMHPVVFGGRSMVSPDNGPVLLLYEKFPTLPSYKKHMGDGSVADVGALMWAHIPYSAVLHKAVFDHHEWPLWDRYNLCGVPLLGQGQTLFGNPLHVLVMAADSAAWAWDVEFVLARWLFAFGLGAAAWLFGAGLAGAVGLAFSAAFIGFFAYRYNHPAIFSVCFAPLILVAWAGLVRLRTPRALLGWLGLMLLASWMELTSGTAKEAVILMLGMHATGALVLLRSRQPWAWRLRKLLAVGASGVVFVLLSAPHWVTFLTTLKQSQTIYDLPLVLQNSPWQIIGLFDDLFFRQLVPLHPMPGSNFLVLLGVGWGVLRFRAMPARRAWAGLMISACALLGVAYGLVPGRLLARIPFIANIHHVGNTFSCVLLVLVLLLAAFGWSQLLHDLGRPAQLSAHIKLMAGTGVLLALYCVWAPRVVTSPFFTGYIVTLMLAVLVLPGVAGLLARHNRRPWAFACLAACVVLCLWRHGQYGQHELFHDYVVNPGQRVDLRGPSPALDLVTRGASEPFRVLGLGRNLTPGYGAMYGVETSYGVDAVRNPRVDELLVALGFKRVVTFEKADPVQTVAARARQRDSLGIRYYFGTSGSWRRPPAGVRLLAKLDLDVYERPEAWPRAFFTDAILLNEGPAAVADVIKMGDGRPLAVLSPDDGYQAPGVTVIPDGNAARIVNPAFSYRLTANDTGFKVNATGPGVVVVSEAYYAHGFQALLDGQPVPIFPVNYAFKGIFVESPGERTVAFRYRGQHFGWSLHLAQAGLVLLVVFALALWFLPKRRLTGPAA